MSSVLARAALRLYPRDFREQFGAEMLRVYEDLRHDERPARRWPRLAIDTLTAAPRLRMEEGMNRSVIVVGSVVLLGVAAVGVATGNFFIGGLLFAGLALVMLVPAALLAKRRRASTESVYRVKPWPLWSFPAVATAVTYLVVGIGMLAHDPKKENVFALAMMTLFAFMIARGLVIRRHGRTSGDWLIAVAALPLFPGFWLVWPPILATIVMIGAMSEALSARPGRA